MNRGEAFVVLTLVFRREGQTWTGECRELGTATYGRSLARTHDHLLRMVRDHLSVLEELGERDRVLRERGIRVYSGEALPATVEQALPLDEETFVHAHRLLISA